MKLHVQFAFKYFLIKSLLPNYEGIHIDRTDKILQRRVTEKKEINRNSIKKKYLKDI